MRLIPLVLRRSYAVKDARLDSISFFMWECKTCRSQGTDLSVWHYPSLYTSDTLRNRQRTSFVNLLIISDFPLIRATRWRVFSASSDRRFRTNHRADSENHLTNHRADRFEWPDHLWSTHWWHLCWRFTPTSYKRRIGSRGHKQPLATFSSLSANKQVLPGSSDQRWRRKKWVCRL